VRTSPEIASTLRADLENARYDVLNVENQLGDVASAALQRGHLGPATDALESLDDPLATLTKVFLLGQDVPADQLQRAIPQTTVDAVTDLGLIARQGQGESDAVRAVVDLRPYAASDASGDVNWWVAADQGEEVRRGPLGADHVLGVGGAAKTLAGITVRDQRKRALDLGTGSGIQALHLSRHCEQIVATDISQRALDFARFNTQLNLGSIVGSTGPNEIDLRQGSFFEPVSRETFDLIVSNPPFVISPPDSHLPNYEYRDGGMRGDELVKDFVTGIGQYLSPGGVAQFLGNWEHRVDEPWEERVGQWADEAAERFGCDVWIVQREVQDPAEYAETWITDGGCDPRRDAETFQAAHRAWRQDFADRGVEAVGFGYVVIRRPHWARTTPLRLIEQVTTATPRALGLHILAALEAEDRLATLSDVDLLDEHLVTASDVTEERYGPPGASDPSMIFLTQGAGYGRSHQVSTILAAFFGACDGDLSVGQICSALAQILNVEASSVIAEVLAELRHFIREGFVNFAR